MGEYFSAEIRSAGKFEFPAISLHVNLEQDFCQLIDIPGCAAGGLDCHQGIFRMGLQPLRAEIPRQAEVVVRINSSIKVDPVSWGQQITILPSAQPDENVYLLFGRDWITEHGMDGELDPGSVRSPAALKQ